MLPYTCGFENGRPVLRPSEAMHSYAVLGGTSDSKVFPGCGPTGVGECRSFRIYQFSIACKGISLPWMKAVAAVRNSSKFRSWIEDGKLKIVFPSRTGAKARCLDAGRTAGNCLPWRHVDAARAMTLDADYAPVEAIGARLVLASGDEIQTGSLGEDTSSASSTGSLLVGAAQAGWVTTTIDAREASQASIASLAPMTPLTWALVALLLSTSAWFAWRRGLGGNVLEFYRSYRLSQLQGGLRQGLDELAAHLARFSGTASAEPAKPSAAPKPPEAAKPAGDPQIENAATFVKAVLTDANERVARLGIGALRGVLEQELYVIAQRLNYTHRAALDGRESSAKSAAIFRTLVREVERLRRIAESAEANGGSSTRDGTLPRSRSEAFAVLGVNPDVSDNILKKLVDALRMSWHPDLGKDDADRAAREERIKQINVAWELVSGKRAAP